MKIYLFAIIILTQFLWGGIGKSNNSLPTICNPLNLSYRFALESPSRREAADPTVVWFKDRYYLFASKSGGYWHSQDLVEWTLIETNQIPTEEYAPTAITIEDTLYFLASSNEKSTIYKSANPLKGKWSVAVEELETPVWDPAFFLDDDDRLYLYWGCSNENPIYGVEIDYRDNFSFIGEPQELIHANPKQYGWEVPGDYNTLTQQNPWIEGAWMNKHKGKYYLQYSGPGTEYKSYADGVYISNSPLGNFKCAPHNPFSIKPEGFICGAGHGSTFKDQYGNYWHIATMTISVKHKFERRLGLFPTFFDEDGTLYTYTGFGDYPIKIPDYKVDSYHELRTEAMLLSFNKKVTASSFQANHPEELATDENVRTYWSAKTGEPGEWIQIDLGKMYNLHSIQVNFAEHKPKLFGRDSSIYYQYIVEYSRDKENWKLLIDKKDNMKDGPHDYTELEKTVDARYIRLSNYRIPSGLFAISGLRIFGKGDYSKPEKNVNLNVERSSSDRRVLNLRWKKCANAVGYNVKYGIDKQKLYHNHIVYQDTSVTIRSLNSTNGYYFSVEAFNENGITESPEIEYVK